ncbi:MAG: 2-dehydro-3-deoxyphosphogluconate aldolase, partial [Clostridia bacterium]|nr:2-dehydro-3-deoxyphosphogluconate aldolase [Clostridia bacterium]
MEKYVPVVVIKELSETDKILTALKNNGINTAEITFRTACAAEAIQYACENY